MEVGDAKDLPSPGMVIAGKLAILCSVRSAVQIDQIKFSGLTPQDLLDRTIIRRMATRYANRIKLSEFWSTAAKSIAGANSTS